MITSSESKVTTRHLARTAYLYIRQSSLRQVLEHTESTARQYALRQRAIALGWPAEQIVVIYCGQGQSGASAVDRAGFQQLVAEVGLGHAGIVLGLEVSRLARSSTDCHRLLELGARPFPPNRATRPSGETRPPALRITIASPSSSPRKADGSVRGSRHVIT